MILDKNDPTGMGLFSRCARNQTCKISNSRPQTAGISKRPSSITKDEINKYQQNLKRKNSMKCKNHFARQESRQQREKKYKKQQTPSVGQYNPTVKQKSKYVWDILKLYQKQHKEVKQREEKLKENMRKQQAAMTKSKVKKQQAQNSAENQQKNETEAVPTKSLLQAMESSATFINSQSKANIYQQHQDDKAERQNLKTFQGKTQYEASSNNYYDARRRQKTAMSSSICQVNMSRMTGRNTPTNGCSSYNKSSANISKINSMEDIDAEVNLNEQRSKIAPRLTKNIFFKQMLGRKNQHQKPGSSNIYDCNIDVIKPNRDGQVKFKLCKGRPKTAKQSDLVYSYTHYDYDSYVWSRKSSVYPNTKKALIPFEKQTRL